MRETVVDRETSPLVEGLFRLAELCASHPEVEDVLWEGVHSYGLLESRDGATRLVRWADSGDVPITRDGGDLVLHFSSRVTATVTGSPAVLGDVAA